MNKPMTYRSDNDNVMIVMSLKDYDAMKAEIAMLRSRKEAPLPDLEDVTFISVRTFIVLQRMGITNLADMQMYTRADYCKQKGLGRKTLADIESLMKIYGLNYKTEE